jgi:hypothetical protein
MSAAFRLGMNAARMVKPATIPAFIATWSGLIVKVK